MRIVAIANQKDGTVKTTTATNIPSVQWPIPEDSLVPNRF